MLAPTTSLSPSPAPGSADAGATPSLAGALIRVPEDRRDRAVRWPGGLRVLLDEAHSEAWTARATQAARMQPHHPADSSYARAAALLDDRDDVVEALVAGPLDDAVLAGVDVLVIAHPSEAEWEATTGVGSPVFAPEECSAVERFVRRGGGLVVLAETEQHKYGTNLDDLLAPFGIAVEHATVQDYAHHHRVPSWVLAEAGRADDDGLLHGVGDACFYRAGVLRAPDEAVILRTSATADRPGAPLMAAVRHGQGRVVVFADSDLFGDDCIDEFGHATLWTNTITWVSFAARERALVPAASPLPASPSWSRLVDAVDELRTLQGADGSVDLVLHDGGQVAALADVMSQAIADLIPLFPHDEDYLRQVVVDLGDWVAQGCGKPDFGRSLARFRPEQARIDGLEHLVVFPLYTPNASLDVRFEALVIRVPWPEWVARLEADGWDNAKFVPVHLVASTSGYDSECAVLFPETVSVVGRAANTFGGIFCDREAERFRRMARAAVDELGLEVPIDVQALIADAGLTQDTFLLWDLVHDRAHSHGDLPFDPFMIRQRLPFWMYALEELRCDLSAFASAGELAEQFPFARNVQYAVLLDRMLRFPVTGSRVRNYDGLAGQLLFGFLHKRGTVTWSDNRLGVDWDALPAAMAELKAEIEALYRRGIDSSRVRYWIDAHDLLCRYVAPNLASRWTPDARADAPDEADFRAWVDRVHEDEFPLTMFFRILARRIAPALTRAAA